MINKNLVKLRFKNSIQTYDDTAIIQKEIAHVLIDKIIENCGNSFDNIFEFGAGTGFLSKNIIEKLHFKEYYANDIIEEAEYCIKNIIDDVKFLAGDIEKIEINKKFNLLVANAVIQWISNLNELFNKLYTNIENNGHFAFTTFGEQNFKEIKETTGVSLNYLKTETLKEKCSNHFEIIHFEEVIQTLYFSSPLDVLKHIKYSGTNGIKTLNWTQTKLKEFDKYYRENFGTNNQVMLTYNPIFVILKPKN